MFLLYTAVDSFVPEIKNNLFQLLEQSRGPSSGRTIGFLAHDVSRREELVSSRSPGERVPRTASPVSSIACKGVGLFFSGLLTLIT